MHDHLTPEQIDHFVRGELPAIAHLQVLVHLLQPCPACVERYGDLLHLAYVAELDPNLPPAEDELAGELLAEASPPDAYDQAFARALAFLRPRRRRFARERARVKKALAAVAASPGGLAGLDAHHAYQFRVRGWAFCEALLDVAGELRYRRPHRVVELVSLAHYVAGNLEPELYGEGPVADLKARASAELANAYRITDRLAEAERTMAMALQLLDQGTGDPLLRARVLDLQASLLGHLQRFTPCLELLDRVHALYLHQGETHLAGRALISKGLYTLYRVDPERAIASFRRGLDLVDHERDPQLVAHAHFNLAHCLVDCGQFREARKLLWQERVASALAGDEFLLLKLRRLEGLIAAGLGDFGRGEELIAEVRQAFTEAGLPGKAAIFGLDLAALYLQEHRTEEAAALIEEILPNLRALDYGRDFLVAVLMLEQAHRQGELTTPLVLDALRRILSVWIDERPGLAQ